METVALSVKSRETEKKAKELLRENLVPIEYYGRGIENKSLQVDYQTFVRAYRVAGENTVVDLDVDGKENLNVIVHRVDRHPVTDRITHIELLHVRMDEKITTKVPVEFVGTAPAVKEQAGVLTPHLTEIEVSCLPKDLIHSLEIDISPLVDFHTVLHVSDLVLPQAVELVTDPETALVGVTAPREEKEEEPVEAAEGEDGEEAAEGGEGEEAKEEGGE